MSHHMDDLPLRFTFLQFCLLCLLYSYSCFFQFRHLSPVIVIQVVRSFFIQILRYYCIRRQCTYNDELRQKFLNVQLSYETFFQRYNYQISSYHVPSQGHDHILICIQHLNTLTYLPDWYSCIILCRSACINCF